MEWWQHAIASTCTAIVAWSLVAYLDVPEFGPMDVLAIFCFSFPDLDQKTVYKKPSFEGQKKKKKATKHRHWLWHSSIIPAITFLLGLYKNNLPGVAVFCVVIGTHLLCDLKPGEDGKTGTYLIYIKKGDRMSRKNTDRYLLANGIFCFIMAALSLTL